MNWKKLIFPPVWAIIFLVLISAVLLASVFAKGLYNSPIVYAIYALSFYSLVVACVFFSVTFPKYYKAIKEKIYSKPLFRKYMNDMAFRTHISLYASFGVNLTYVAINALSFVFYKSMWFVVLAMYYAILAIMRFLLLRYIRCVGIGNDRVGELKRTMLCSSVLLTVNFVLSGAVLMILYQNKGFEYNGILIYVAALYTFYITVQAIVNMVKYRKYNSPVMLETRVISFSAAIVSMLALETAMLSQFGQKMPPSEKNLLIALTGGAVSLAVVVISVCVIVNSHKELKKIRGKK